MPITYVGKSEDDNNLSANRNPLDNIPLRFGYYYDTQDQAAILLSSSNLYLYPEYRYVVYHPFVYCYVDGYNQQYIKMPVNIQEKKIPSIELNDRLDFNIFKQYDKTIEPIEFTKTNRKNIFKYVDNDYPFIDRLVIEDIRVLNNTSATRTPSFEYITEEGNSDVIIRPNLQGMSYTLQIVIEDLKFKNNHILDGVGNYVDSNIGINIEVSERGPISVNLVDNTITYDRIEDNIINISDYIVINRDDFTKEQLIYENNAVPNLRRGYYNGNKQAVVRDTSNLYIYPEYRGKDYTYSYNVYLDGYSDQKEIFRLNVVEQAIPTIEYTGSSLYTIQYYYRTDCE